MSIHTTMTVTLLPALLLTGLVGAAPQQAQSPLQKGEVRRNFIEKVVSLESVARESRRQATQPGTIDEDQFSAEQRAPGHAARMLASEGIPTGTRSLFSPLPIKAWNEHDQVTIVVLENSKVSRTQELETDKDWELGLEVAVWTDFFNAGNLFTSNGGDNLPRFEFAGAKGFDGEGDYGSQEAITFRTTATVLEVLPNGNLVLQARHTTKTDAETTVKTITGTVDPRHVAPDDTILHWRLYDLDLNIQNSGLVKDAADKGIVAQILDAIFAF